MSDSFVNHAAQARDLADTAAEGIGSHPEAAQTYAQLAAAHASLALYDAVLALRDEIEALPARLNRT